MSTIKYIQGVDGTLYERYKVSLFETDETGCFDCGKSVGEYHKDNCDIERCPICGGQMLSCNCWDSYVDKKY